MITNRYSKTEIAELGELDFLLPWMEARKGWSKNRFKSAALELCRFFELVASSNEPLALLHSDVDDLWHNFIVWTEKYRRFCDQRIGFFVDHVPDTPEQRIGYDAVVRFVDKYETKFGALPEVWTERFSGLGSLRISDSDAVFSGLKWSGWPGRQLS